MNLLIRSRITAVLSMYVISAQVTMQGAHLRKCTALYIRIQLQIVAYNVCNGLGVRGGTRPAAVDAVMYLGKLVGDAILNIRARCGARVGAEYHAVSEGYSHNRGLWTTRWELAREGEGEREK